MVYEGSEHFISSSVRISLTRTNSSSTPAYYVRGRFDKVLDYFTCIKSRPNKPLIFRDLREINPSTFISFLWGNFV